MSVESAVPAPPRGLGTAGRALWRELVKAYELQEHETRLLLECARTADLLDELQAEVRARGAVGEDGEVRRVVVEARQQRLVLARLVTSLRVPDADGARGPARGARGSYGGGRRR